LIFYVQICANLKLDMLRKVIMCYLMLILIPLEFLVLEKYMLKGLDFLCSNYVKKSYNM